tara:strand:- start:1324 stop:1944 length:621 start_codon:yes stop_codon:yes gene_type:complete
MKRFFVFFLLFLSSCDKGTDLIIEETAFPEIAEVYLLNDLDPGFVFPENLQYMASNGVNSSVCIDISENFYSQYGSGFAPMQSAAARNTSVALDRPLKTHTCHSDYNRRNVSIGGAGGVSPDQGFEVSKISVGEFSFPFYNVCMEVENIRNRSDLILRECDQNPNQKFVLVDGGKIKPANDLNFCLTASANYDWYGGGIQPYFYCT